MLITNLKIALRNLYRERLYAAINVASLTLAVVCCLTLSLYLRSELTYDQHFDNHETLYRIVNDFTVAGQSSAFAVTSPALGVLMTQDFDEIEDYVGFDRVNTPIFIRNENFADRWLQAFYVTSNVFQVFDHEIVYGDPDQEMTMGRSVAISESFSQRYFGNTNPVGGLLENELGEPYIVALVFADLPESTHLKYDLLIFRERPDADLTQLQQMLYGIRDFTYLKTTEEFDPADFPAMADAFFERHMLERANQIGDTSVEFFLEPLSDIHYSSTMPYDEQQGNQAYLYAFGVVAAFILIVACINYTNLATARSIRRSKEVGLRKILGADRSTLILQFLMEAVLYTLVAALIALGIVNFLADSTWLTGVLGKPVSFNLLQEPELMLWLAIFTLGVGLLAGLYPAIYLSSWAPLSALVSSGKSAGRGNILFRQGLVLAQFTISIAVVAATLLMSNQMRFISTRDLGFDEENLVTVRMIGADLIEKTEVIKTEFLNHPDILGATLSFRLPGQGLPVNILDVESADGTDVHMGVIHTNVDANYLSVMEMEIVAGRDYSERLLTDVGQAAIVNESMVRQMGWSDPIGKRIAEGSIIGVVKDFHFSSLHNEIEPLLLNLIQDDFSDMPERGRNSQVRYLTIRLADGDTRGTLNYIQERFAEFDPVHTVQIEFLDDQLDELYSAENTMTRLIGIFAGICIFIAALGLFGLASFTTEQRSKEIAIRKVLGANAGQIILMLSKSVLSLVLIGALIASVIAYWALNEWLASFAYRTNISIWTFVVAAAAALLVALFTMGLQSYRTAQSNPVDALRSE